MADSSFIRQQKDDLARQITNVIAGLGKMSEEVQKQTIRVMSKAAGPLIEEIQFRAPVSDEPHFRYQTNKLSSGIRAPKGYGNVVATYMPGNLERSFSVLRFRRSKSAVYVGARLNKSGSTGTFSGQRTDGYYAAWQEYGAPAAGIPPRPFIGPSVDSTKNEIAQIAKIEFTKVIEKEAKKMSATDKFLAQRGQTPR